MQEDLDRYARAAAGAAFVVIWVTLGFEVALLALVGGVGAAALPRLRNEVARRRRAEPRSRRVRRREDLPLVPDEPSLVLTVADL